MAGGVAVAGGASCSVECRRSDVCRRNALATVGVALSDLCLLGEPSALCPPLGCETRIAGWSADGAACLRYDIDAGFCGLSGQCAAQCSDVTGLARVEAARCASVGCAMPTACAEGSAASAVQVGQLLSARLCRL